MSMTDPIADLLTRIRNAGSARHSHVEVRFSNIKKSIVEILNREGFIKGFEVREESKNPVIIIELKYHKKQPVIRRIERVSKPGRRIFVKNKDIKPVFNNLGVGIISTPKGVISSVEAKRLGVGGEMLCQIF